MRTPFLYLKSSLCLPGVKFWENWVSFWTIWHWRACETQCQLRSWVCKSLSKRILFTLNMMTRGSRWQTYFQASSPRTAYSLVVNRCTRERIPIGSAWSHAHLLAKTRQGTSAEGPSVLVHVVDGCPPKRGNGPQGREKKIKTPSCSKAKARCSTQCFIQMWCRKKTRTRVIIGSTEAYLGEAMCMTPPYVDRPVWERLGAHTSHTQFMVQSFRTPDKKLVPKTVTLQSCL